MKLRVGESKLVDGKEGKVLWTELLTLSMSKMKRNDRATRQTYHRKINEAKR